jgi:prepilin signal peptidase PulO-like enzyme (type II secretory pathway)
VTDETIVFLGYLILSVGGAAAAVADFKARRLPKIYLGLFAIGGAMVASASNGLDLERQLQMAILVVALGHISWWGMKTAGFVLLGRGDINLVGAILLFLGPAGTWVTLVCGLAAAIIFIGIDREQTGPIWKKTVALGPFLIPFAVLVLIYQNG